MFGLLVPGRLVDTEMEVVDDSRFKLALPEPYNVSHLSVFLTGETPLPDGFGASIYLCWPSSSPDGEPIWKYMGFISNEKPSALFKLSNLLPKTMVPAEEEGQHHEQQYYNEENEPDALPVLEQIEMAEIGIAIESFEEIEQSTEETSDNNATTYSDLEGFLSFAVESLFNFSASFSVDTESAMERPNEQWFPLSSLQRWHDRILTRLSLNPNFWRISASNS
eukprot:m.115702 g.115702  ORF g.115702 m.115702 type:complete len:222 (-) comp12843_c0_seq2:1362-2027(-)